MRVFELTAHVQAISRADGRTATAAAAYRACCAITCEREGRTHDYSRKGGLEAAEISAPDGAPNWAKDRARLWNAAELAERNKDRRAKNRDKANARPARELLFSFPVELSQAGRLQATRTIARHLVDRHQVVADFAIHRPGREGDQRNYHCHLMWTARRLTGQAFGAKTREWDNLTSGREHVRALRAFVARTLNDALAAEGHGDAVHVEHRSFKDRGEAGKPTAHDGPGRTNAQRREQSQARTAWRQATQARQQDRHREERIGLSASQEFARRTKLDHLAEQERRGIEAIRKRLAEENAADQPAKGIRRALDVASGRAALDDQARVQRAADRAAQADRMIAELRQGMQAERDAYDHRQREEARGLAERQTGEDRQLKQAAAARISADQLALVQARRDRSHQHQQEHEHERMRPR